MKLLISLWRQALCKGAEFILTPAVLEVNGERRYSHPMTCNWGVRMQQLIQTVEAIKEHALASELDISHLLAFSLFSDKTNVGNLSAYPVQIAQMHSSLKDIHAIFAGGHGICAYIPVAEKPAGKEDAEHTEQMNMLLARCLNKVSTIC